MDWYYVVGNERIGPLSDEAFQSLIDDGTIQPDTLVWNETMEGWQKFDQKAEEEATGDQVPCAECGKYFSTDDVIQYENAWVCASCKPLFLQKLKEGLNVSGAFRYAGFWIRAAAAIIDGIILWIIQLIVTTPFTLMFSGIMMGNLDQMEEPDFQNLGLMVGLQFFLIFLQFAVAIAYETWFVGKYAATPGKMACKIKVIKSDGEKVGYGLAFGRYFGKIVSSIILFIGFIMAGFDEQKRALHDHMCNTRVVYKD